MNIKIYDFFHGAASPAATPLFLPAYIHGYVTHVNSNGKTLSDVTTIYCCNIYYFQYCYSSTVTLEILCIYWVHSQLRKLNYR